MSLSCDCRLWNLDKFKHSKSETLDETRETGDVDKKSPFYCLGETEILKIICDVVVFFLWVLILCSMHN